MDTTPSSLLARFQCGDTKAKEEFSRIYRPGLLEMFVGRGFSPTDAEDLTQNTLMAVLRYIKTYNDMGDGSFRAWLGKVVQNASNRWVRRKRVPPVGGSEHQAVLEAAQARLDGVDVQFEKQHDAMVVRHKLEDLTREGVINPTHGRVAWMVFVDGVARREVVKAMKGTEPEVTLGNVNTICARVAKRLRAEMAGLANGP